MTAFQNIEVFSPASKAYVFSLDLQPALNYLRTQAVAAKGNSDTDCTEVAQQVAFALAKSWWSSVCARRKINLDLRLPDTDIEETPFLSSNNGPVFDFGHVASQIDPIYAAFEIGQAYSNLLPGQAQKSGGIHYTPPQLARWLARQATPSEM